jgi:hypothetical protein
MNSPQPICPGGTTRGNESLIHGNRWTYPRQSGEETNLTYFRVVNTFDKIEYRQEYSKDHVHWTPMRQGTEIQKNVK